LLAGGEGVWVADERMLEELFCRRAVGVLDLEGLLEEVVGFRRDVVGDGGSDG
jgi:hypothetical protein